MGIEQIACVTGASGHIGRRLVDELKEQKFQIRVLKHRSNINSDDLSVFHGDICNQELLEDFLADAQYVFHFAAELNDQDRMWEINVNGTQKIVAAAKNKNIKYFCFLSSAGVVGETSQKEINEYIQCRPQNLYEKSKLEAERIILSGIENCQVIALRPTNVVDENNHGVMESLNSNSWLAKIKLFIRGGECAHVVHADDVVNAAVYFMDKQFDKPECFFVSSDGNPLNTFAGLRLLYDAFERKQSLNSIRKHWHVPITIPFVLRKILRGNGNMGDVKYSSKKILSYGFSYKVGLKETIKKYWENQQEYK